MTSRWTRIIVLTAFSALAFVGQAAPMLAHIRIR